MSELERTTLSDVLARDRAKVIEDLQAKLHASEERAEDLLECLTQAQDERDSARSSLARVVEALEFYANPWKFKDANGEPVRVPDFYSELDFADRARSALHRSQGDDC